MTTKKNTLTIILLGLIFVSIGTNAGTKFSKEMNSSCAPSVNIYTGASTESAPSVSMPDLVLHYTFSSTNDESGTHKGTLGGSATLSTLNNIPILNLGSNNGYFDMGESVGSIISSLNESFTISMNVFISESYSLGKAGNFIFNFGHSSNTGYLFFSANDTRYSITRTNYSGESTLSLDQFFTQGEWTNLTYTQNQSQGTIYLNGEKMATGYISLHPSDLGNTTQNWLGRSPYNGDVFLKNACYNDVRIYNGEITETDITQAYSQENLNKLNESVHKEQLDEFLTTLTLDFSDIRADISLPISFDNGISVTWKSSNENIIKDNGEVTRPQVGESDANVMLTATFTKGNISETKEYQATVLAIPDDETALAYDLANLSLSGNLNNLRNDLQLPTATTEGTILTWTSSDQDFISDAGKLLRLAPSGYGKKEITLTATGYKNALKDTKAFNINVAEKEDYDSYLFVYFPNNSNENLYYAISKDGYDYTPLNNGERIMWSDTVAIKKGIRDPHILRGEDGKTFYMVATDMRCSEGWDSNRGIVMYKSTDMIHWQHSTVHFPDKFPEWANVTRVWAPETIWDPDYENADGTKGRYMVYFSLLTNDGKCPYDKVFYCYANDDFTDLISDPVFLYDRGSATIDADIIFDDREGIYHMIYKNEGTGGICQVTSERLTAEPGKPEGSQWSEPSGTLQQTNVAVEGGGLYRLINSDTWILMYDCYGSGYYQFCSSEDLETFTLRAQTTTSGAFTPRHGTVIPITKAETDALLSAFPTGSTEITLTDFNNRNILKERITEENNIITLPVRQGTDISRFDPEPVLSPGCSTTPAGEQDFSNGSIEYTADNGLNSKKFTLKVEVMANPVIEDFHADPDIIFSQKTGKFYIYAATDNGTDSSAGIDVFSSSDLVNWQKEGQAFDDGYAPTVIEKQTNGQYKYFMYYNTDSKDENKKHIGLAVSDRPTGPFKDYGIIVTGSETGSALYPDVYTDEVTGKTYLYWNDGDLMVCELDNNIPSDGTSVNITAISTGLSSNYAPVHVFCRNGIYYFLWNNSTNGNTENSIIYGTSTSPVGPVTMTSNNIILSSVPDAGIYGTGNCAVIRVPGEDEWYLVYQRINKNHIDEEPAAHHEICIDRLTFNEDGSIAQTTATEQGIQPVSISEYIEDVLSKQVSTTINIEHDWATLILPFDAPIPTGMQVYTCNSIANDNYLSLMAANTISANTPYIVFGNGTYYFSGINSATTDEYSSGLLTGVLQEKAAPVGSYVLQNQNGVVAFYKVESTIQPTITPYHAYLQLPDNIQSSNIKALLIDFDQTGISTTPAETDDDFVDVYYLNGIKALSKVRKADALNSLKPGIYIINGQKVIN